MTTDSTEEEQEKGKGNGDAMEEDDSSSEKTKEFLLEVLISMCEKRLSHFDAISDMPLYPNEVG